MTMLFGEKPPLNSLRRAVWAGQRSTRKTLEAGFAELQVAVAILVGGLGRNAVLNGEIGHGKKTRIEVEIEA